MPETGTASIAERSSRVQGANAPLSHRPHHKTTRFWPQPHKEVLVLNGYFPLVLHKKFREYDSMPGIFIFIQTKNFSIQNCSHPEGLDFGCSLSEKGKHNLTVCLPFLRENAPKDRFSGQNCLMWLWPSVPSAF